jgi:protein TonB
VERCSRRLIRRAARTAPAPLAERLEEEWQADLATRRSAASRLRFALGCCWATRVIAREHFAPIPAAGAAVGAKPGGAKLAFLHPGPQTRLLSRRSIALLVVVCLHIAVFYALLSGLAYKITRVIPTDFQTHIIDQPRPREILPVLPTPPRLAPRLADRVFVPPDLPPVQDLPEKSNLAPQPVDPMPRASSTADSQLTPHVMPPHVVDRVQGGPGSGFPNPDEYYPMMARHLQEEGVATVRVCVDPRGRLTSDPTTIESTGSARLDAGALELARAGSGHYRPSLEDGRPVNSCYAFRVRFQLRN